MTTAPAPASLPRSDAAPAPARSLARSRRRKAGRASFGSARQLPSGRWQARYSDVRGLRHTAPQTFPSKRQAEDWLATTRADMVRGTWRAPDVGAVALADYAGAYLASRLDLAPSTRAMYERLLRVWFTTALTYPPAPGRHPLSVTLGTVELRALNVAAVREWYAAALHTATDRAQARAAASARWRRAEATHAAREWARANGLEVKDTGRLPGAVLAAWKAAGEPAAQLHTLAPDPAASTDTTRGAGRVQVAHAYRLLRLVLGNAVREGLLEANPCQIAGAGTIKARERVPATLAELDAIAAAVPERYRAAVHVAAWSGLRAGELFGLPRRHVDLAAGTVRVDQALVEYTGAPLHLGPPKTESSRRTVHLPPHVVELLAAHLASHTASHPDALVFTDPAGAPLDRARRTKMFRRACVAAGRPDLRWHDLRHTGATMATRAGASLREVQARLGHSTVAAAMVYQHASADRDRDLAARMSLLVTGPRADESTEPPAAVAALTGRSA